jgi:hypothetical protein
VTVGMSDAETDKGVSRRGRRVWRVGREEGHCGQEPQAGSSQGPEARNEDSHSPVYAQDPEAPTSGPPFVAGVHHGSRPEKGAPAASGSGQGVKSPGPKARWAFHELAAAASRLAWARAR